MAVFIRRLLAIEVIVESFVTDCSWWQLGLEFNDDEW